eukprot:jgi/Tetstr1/461483/TSEL_006589.t1
MTSVWRSIPALKQSLDVGFHHLKDIAALRLSHEDRLDEIAAEVERYEDIVRKDEIRMAEALTAAQHFGTDWSIGAGSWRVDVTSFKGPTTESVPTSSARPCTSATPAVVVAAMEAAEAQAEVSVVVRAVDAAMEAHPEADEDRVGTLAKPQANIHPVDVVQHGVKPLESRRQLSATSSELQQLREVQRGAYPDYSEYDRHSAFYVDCKLTVIVIGGVRSLMAFLDTGCDYSGVHRPVVDRMKPGEVDATLQSMSMQGIGGKMEMQRLVGRISYVINPGTDWERKFEWPLRYGHRRACVAAGGRRTRDEGVIWKGDPGDFYMKVIAKKFRGVWHYGVITGVVTEWVLEDYGGATQWRAVFEDGDIVDLLRSEVVEAMAAAQEHPTVDADGEARLVTVHQGDDLSRSGKVTVQSGWVMEDCLHHMETFSILNAGPLLEEARVKAIMTEKELRVPRRAAPRRGGRGSAAPRRGGRGSAAPRRGGRGSAAPRRGGRGSAAPRRGGRGSAAPRRGGRGSAAPRRGGRGSAAPRQRRPGQRGAKARRPGQRGAKARRPGQRGAKTAAAGAARRQDSGGRGSAAPRQRRPGQRGAKARRPGQRGAKARRPGQRGAKVRRPGQRGAKARRPGQRGAKARRPGQRGAKTAAAGAARRQGAAAGAARRQDSGGRGSAAPRQRRPGQRGAKTAAAGAARRQDSGGRGSAAPRQRIQRNRRKGMHYKLWTAAAENYAVMPQQPQHWLLDTSDLADGGGLRDAGPHD